MRSGPSRSAILLAPLLMVAACLPANSRGSAHPTSPPGVAGPRSSDLAASAEPSGPTASPSFVRPTPTPGPTFMVYTVKAGDSLTSIARQFKTTGRSIAYWNGATYPSLDPESAQYQPGLLKVGWTLQILPNVTFDEQTLPEPSDLVEDTPSAPVDGASQEPSASEGY